MSEEDTEVESGARPGWVIPVIALTAVAVVIGWFWLRDPKPPAPVAVAEPVEAVAPAEEPSIQHPLDDGATPPSDAPVPLPALGDSDAPLLVEFATLASPDAVSSWIVPNGIVRRLVATVDNMPRTQVSEKVRALRPVPEAIIVERSPIDTATGEERIVLSTANYARYDSAVKLLSGMDMKQVGLLYRSYYPLFQQAYEDLGYPGRYFNDRLVAVIDHLLETPIPAEPPALVQPKAMYEFADVGLEERSAGQKMLIRMGPQHAAVVKKRLTELRAQITQGPQPGTTGTSE